MAGEVLHVEVAPIWVSAAVQIRDVLTLLGIIRADKNTNTEHSFSAVFESLMNSLRHSYHVCSHAWL